MLQPLKGPLAEVFGIIYEYATELGLPNEAILIWNLA